VEVALAVGGQLEQRRDPRRAQVPPRPAERQVHRRRQRGAHLRRRDGQVARSHLRAVDAHGETDGFAAEARERPDERRGRSTAIEHLARPAGDDRGRQAVQDDRRVAVRRVHRPLDPVEPVAERRVVDLGRRGDVGAEEAEVEPPEAAERAEALSLAPDRVHCRSPVDLDPEAPGLELPDVCAGAEGHRDGGKRFGLCLEDALGLLGRLAADLDAGDTDAAGEPAGAPREGQAEHDRREGGDRGEDRGPLPEDAALSARAAAAGPVQQPSAPGRQAGKSSRGGSRR
jgi:hypothetical protein